MCLPFAGEDALKFRAEGDHKVRPYDKGKHKVCPYIWVDHSARACSAILVNLLILPDLFQSST